mgnify:CR=1 FL=1
MFDEVDAGVGGATAEAVGKRLQALAENVQVLVITHSPQVAAKGAEHLRVAKSDAKNGQMKTTVTPLDADQRRLEVARMLAGDRVTPEAEAAAAAVAAAEASAEEASAKAETRRLCRTWQTQVAAERDSQVSSILAKKFNWRQTKAL